VTTTAGRECARVSGVYVCVVRLSGPGLSDPVVAERLVAWRGVASPRADARASGLASGAGSDLKIGAGPPPREAPSIPLGA
jgi:hypothetical protein